MYSIRQFNPDDFDMIHSWFKDSCNIELSVDSIPIDTTFIGLIDGEPALCISLFLFNSKDVAMLENFVGNPLMKGDLRRGCATVLIEFCYDYLRSMGFKNVICFSMGNKLVDRYQELGMELVASGLSSFGKRLL